MQAAVENKALTCVKRFLTWHSPHGSQCVVTVVGQQVGVVLWGSILHAATQHLLRAKHIRVSWMTSAGYFSVSLLLGQTPHTYFGIAILDHQEKSPALRCVCQQACAGFELCCSQLFLPYLSGLKN